MRSVFILFLLSLSSKLVFAQYYDHNKICSTDTIQVDTYNHKVDVHFKYKAVECTQVSKFAIRIDLGYNLYSYNEKTKQWLGNHQGALFGLSFAYGNWGFGARFKPATINPKKELVFDDVYLEKNAKLNPIKIEYDLNYSFNFKYNVSFEPYIALTSNSFYVINEDELNQQYNISKVRGLAGGITINKYFRVVNFEYLSLFAKCGYSATNFNKVNAELGRGYADISFGIAYKGYSNRKFIQPID